MLWLNIAVVLLILAAKISHGIVFEKPLRAEEVKQIILREDFVLSVLIKEKLSYEEALRLYKEKKTQQVKGLMSLLKEYELRKREAKIELDRLKYLISAYEIPESVNLSDIEDILLNRVFKKHQDFNIQVPVISGVKVEYGYEEEAYKKMDMLNKVNLIENLSQSLVNLRETFGETFGSYIRIEKFGSVDVLEAPKPCYEYTKSEVRIVTMKVYLFFPFKQPDHSHLGDLPSGISEVRESYSYSYIIPEGYEDISSFLKSYIQDGVVFGKCLERFFEVFDMIPSSLAEQKRKLLKKQDEILEEYMRIRDEIFSFIRRCKKCRTVNDLVEFFDERYNNLSQAGIIRSYVTKHEREPINLRREIKNMLEESISELIENLKADYMKFSEELKNLTDFKATSEQVTLEPFVKSIEVYPFVKGNKFGVVVEYGIILKESVEHDKKELASVKIINFRDIEIAFIRVKLKNEMELWISQVELPMKLVKSILGDSAFEKNCLSNLSLTENLDDYPAVCIKEKYVRILIAKLNSIIRRSLNGFYLRLPTCDEMEKLIYSGLDEKGECMCLSRRCEPIVNTSYMVKVNEGELNAIGLYNLCGNVSEVCEEEGFLKAIGGNFSFVKDAYQIPLKWYYEPRPYYGIRPVLEVGE